MTFPVYLVTLLRNFVVTVEVRGIGFGRTRTWSESVKGIGIVTMNIVIGKGVHSDQERMYDHKTGRETEIETETEI
jgi:hypothetical protein